MKIRLKTPWEKLSRTSRDALLEGCSGFPGILAMLQEIYRDASADYREWLSDYMSPVPCAACNGKRLRPSSLAVRVRRTSRLRIHRDAHIPCSANRALVGVVRSREADRRARGGRDRRRLEFLDAVGLHYLSLERSAATLSGGEAQRIRLATQIGSKLRGVLYVLDEPSIGLHPRDNARLLETLTSLRDMGNTVLVVEHDAETIERADYVIDLGPGAGRLGGELVASGPPDAIRRDRGIADRPVSGGPLRNSRTPESGGTGTAQSSSVRGATEHNLKKHRRGVSAGQVHRRHGRFGKRQIDSGERHPVSRDGAGNLRLARSAGRARLRSRAREHRQSHSRSTNRRSAALRDRIRRRTRDCLRRSAIFMRMLPESRERGYKPGRFSFNVKGGRCEACQGDGLKRIEMNFLPDVYVTCDVCRGRRYNYETLQVKYKGYSIADLLELTVEEALPIMENNPQIRPKLQTLLMWASVTFIWASLRRRFRVAKRSASSWQRN